ncbi:MAG: InlB B-repeat-containing protein [bacterium]|nr:InlB B-repeat-containing protein [bacterium]MCM1376339.1 InlB B-repeat-containing protein [Muribaculum sp.]
MGNKETAVQSAKSESYIKCKYIVKALQSNNQPDVLAWSSVGDVVNFNADEGYVLDLWRRKGVLLCSAERFNTPDQAGFFLTDYDGLYDIPSNGNKLFKAVMIKISHEVMLPAYTKVSISQDIMIPVCKRSDSSSSSTYVGYVLSDRDSCKTIGKNNCSSEWSGIPQDERYDSDETNEAYYDLYDVTFTHIKSEDKNESKSARYANIVPLYHFSMIERPKSYTTYLGVMDIRSTVGPIQIVCQYTSGIRLVGKVSVVDKKYEYYERHNSFGTSIDLNGVTLSEDSAEGYILQGWLDTDNGMLYPGNGFFNERRGMYLRGQYVPESVKYTVRHNYVEDDYCEEETLYNMAGAQVTPCPHEKSGFERPAPITATVQADGSTVIEYCYYPAKYAVQYSANGGTFGETDFIEEWLPYNHSIPNEKHDVSRRGYTFIKWGSLPGLVPNHSVLTCAMWESNRYNVNFMTDHLEQQRWMPMQTFYYDEEQRLYKNEYTNKYTINFEIVTGTGEKFGFNQEANCIFVGWATENHGAKVYNDEEIVRNLTDVEEGRVSLYAVWESASVRLPQFTRDGYYLDAWYLDEGCTESAGKAGSEYTPTGDVTLYGKLICTKVENAEWDIRSAEYVYERPIWATWKAVEGAKAYRVGLESEAKRVNYPLYAEDFKGDNITYVNAGAIEVIGTELDFTEALKRFTAGGTFNFSVTPVFENIPEGSIGGTVSNTVTTLARPENLGWQEPYTAVWDSVEGADYYLLWIVDEDENPLDETCSFEPLEEVMDLYGEHCIRVYTSGNSEESIDLSAVYNIAFLPMAYQVLAYSSKETIYTPQYDKLTSSIVF